MSEQQSRRRRLRAEEIPFLEAFLHDGKCIARDRPYHRGGFVRRAEQPPVPIVVGGEEDGRALVIDTRCRREFGMVVIKL